MILDWAKYTKFRDGFAEGMDPSMQTIEALDAQYLNGEVQLFATENSAIITEVHDYPGARTITGLWATGDLEEMVGELIPRAEDWARSVGCTRVLIESREGWLRALKEHGYRKFSVTVTKEL